MSSTGINILTTGTINGLNSLALDELTTNTFTSGTISGDLFYIDRVEAKEVIVDTRLTLTDTGVISVGNKIITDIELTYLDGVTSNIQAQINAVSGAESGLTSTVALHTTQITALQATDVIHSNQITALQNSDTSQNTLLGTHTNQINALNYAVEGQIANINNHTAQITALQTSDGLQNTAITELQTKTQNISTTTNSS